MGPFEQAQLQGAGNVHSARPASSSFGDSPITVSSESLQGSCVKSGVASAGGFSTGYATVATCTVQADDEELGTLGGKHEKG